MSAEHGHRKHKSKRRKLIELGIKGAVVALALDAVNHSCYNSTQPVQLDEQRVYEKRHALPEQTLHAHQTGYKFGYPKVPEGWGFVNLEGDSTLTTMLEEDLAIIRKQNELQFFLYGQTDSIIFPGIYMSTYLDSTGRLVPRISYKSGIMTNEEYVLVGHISEPRGSFSNRHPDIIRIYNEYYPEAPTYYASLTASETRGRLRSYRTINVTPLRMVELPKPPGS